MLGGGGDDWLGGGTGADSLTGGAGADDFVFATLADSAAGAARDRIHDFVPGQDDLVLSAIDARASVAGNQAFALDLDGSFSEGEVRQVLASGQLRIEVNADADATPELSILLLGLTVRLTAGDFLL